MILNSTIVYVIFFNKYPGNESLSLPGFFIIEEKEFYFMPNLAVIS